MSRLSKAALITFVVATLAGSCLHFVYALWPNGLTALLAPVNESLWEHVKILYWPCLLSGLLLVRREPESLGARAFSLLLSAAVMLGVGYLYHVVLEGDSLFFAVALYVLVMAAFFLLPCFLRTPVWSRTRLLWVVLVLALGAALTLGEMALDYRRRRPRRRWRDAGLVLLSLSVVWIVILPPFFFWGVSGEKELARATLGLGIATLVACVVCLLRWRRLRAEAEMRLWNAEDVTCFAPVPRRKEVGDETPEMVLCDCFGVCGRAGDVPAQFFVGGAVAAACGGKFPAVRPARIALGMDAQGAAYRQAQRIPWDCRVRAIPQMCRSRHPCRICRAY